MTSTLNGPLNPSPHLAAPQSLAARLAVFASDIKIHHTVFALPWALLSAVLAGHWHPGSMKLGKLLLVVVAMAEARTAAMSANRLFDADLDAANPRTAGRAVPSGKLSRLFVTGMLLISVAIFLLACAGFKFWYQNALPLKLCAPVLAFLLAYPLLKRFTGLCHYYLGAALALAPICAWVAIAGRFDWPPLMMFAAVLTWTAGFDIIYACQDYQSDLATGTFSIPAKLGIARALWVSRATHAVCAAAIFALAIFVPEFHLFFAIAAVTAAILLIIEQALVSPTDLARVNLSFFTINGVISILIATLGIVDILRS